MSSMYFKYVLSASEIFITLEMQLVHLPGVYIGFFFFSSFPCAAAEGINGQMVEGGDYKEYVFIGIG